ncbi:hypothetical protein Pcinc_033996 [Petrolisthes cinctipes]|uniref:Uncharacterized protein n=1 Tax=Petrolisthes cinctipes TaxID=88211 RepID=A0AAE1ER95_PETCI|nr:hypothetical protein Pcinc_033996 [Petrolisthes cinctipes]
MGSVCKYPGAVKCCIQVTSKLQPPRSHQDLIRYGRQSLVFLPSSLHGQSTAMSGIPDLQGTAGQRNQKGGGEPYHPLVSRCLLPSTHSRQCSSPPPPPPLPHHLQTASLVSHNS